jgi:hypothetical protein
MKDQSIAPTILTIASEIERSKELPEGFDLEKFKLDANAVRTVAIAEDPAMKTFFAIWAASAFLNGIVFETIPKNGTVSSPFLPCNDNDPVFIVANQDAYVLADAVRELLEA